MSADPDSQYPDPWQSDSVDEQAHHRRPGMLASPNPSIIDPYADVLNVLSPQARRGLIAQLAVGFYDGWRPGRAEVADLVAVKLGILTVDEGERRKQLRDGGYQISDIDVTRASPKTIHPRPSRSAHPHRERDHRGQWTNTQRPGELSHPEPPDDEGQS